MKMPVDSLTCLVGQRRITTHVPDAWIGNTPLADFPDDWFLRLKDDESPVLGRQSPMLYFSRKGWKANRDKLRQAWEACTVMRNPEATWETVEMHAVDFFAKVEKRIETMIKKRKDEIKELEAFVV